MRTSYVRALVLLGGRDALPALEKAASQGDWYAREAAMRGVAMLGSEQEQQLFPKWAQNEPALTAKECQEYGGDGCDNPEALGLKRGEVILRYAKVLEAAKACTAAPNCWGSKLADKEPRVMERAALELGRSGSPQHAAALAGRLSEKNLDTRMALIQGLDWLVTRLQGGGGEGARVAAEDPGPARGREGQLQLRECERGSAPARLPAREVLNRHHQERPVTARLPASSLLRPGMGAYLPPKALQGMGGTMMRLGWKRFVVAGLLGLTALALGCSERGKEDVHQGARKAGQKVGKAAKEVQQAGKEAAEGFRQGWRGSGEDKNLDGGVQPPPEPHP